MDYIFLVLGFVLLIKGADALVDSASNIAKALKVSPIFIGLTIVAFGTSTPEASVSIIASLSHQNSMAIGNVVGSNIFNLLMVVGTTAFIKTLDVEESILHKEFPLVLTASSLMLLLSLDMSLGYFDGFILLLLFVMFLFYLMRISLNPSNFSLLNKEISISMDSDTIAIDKNKSILKSILLSIVSTVSILFGGKIVVNSASSIANTFGVSSQLISVTIVAIGTSLPEFITSLTAATKGESALALGSVIGSNMFNTLFVLGMSAFVSPMNVDPKLIIDSIFMIVSTVILFIFAYRKNDISKYESLTLIGLYLCYITYLIMST
ncbi:calcium/sodium antiporter [[Clostridium] dakarense]|uniref:calcium/sodium antiporter n=1 Tax=Faecalimicrobium dakarense TaxID=1301100 RepID=UPI0004B728CE|nr:calcium/sodium antiporter [[Clostridium] dakarense]